MGLFFIGVPCTYIPSFMLHVLDARQTDRLLQTDWTAYLIAWQSISSVIAFLARDVGLIYTSHAYAMMPVRLSVCLSVTFVHCGHTVRWIPDIFACLDR